MNKILLNTDEAFASSPDLSSFCTKVSMLHSLPLVFKMLLLWILNQLFFISHYLFKIQLLDFLYLWFICGISKSVGIMFLLFS